MVFAFAWLIILIAIIQTSSRSILLGMGIGLGLLLIISIFNLIKSRKIKTFAMIGVMVIALASIIGVLYLRAPANKHLAENNLPKI